MQIIIAITVFGVVFASGLFGLRSYEKRKNREQVYNRLRFSREHRGADVSESFFSRLPVSLGKYAVPENEGKISDIKRQLSYAGYRGSSAVEKYYGSIILTTLGFTAIGILIVVALGWFGGRGILVVLMLVAVGYYAPRILLSSRIKERNKSIFRELPDALDLLILCVGAGLGFEAALFRVSRELKGVAPVLSKEFSQYFFETRSGVARQEALVNLKERNDSAGLRAVADVVIQSVRFGTDSASALRVHSESMRTERRQIAEEKGAKIAVKLTIPLILLIIPALLVVILGPAALRLLRYL